METKHMSPEDKAILAQLFADNDPAEILRVLAGLLVNDVDRFPNFSPMDAVRTKLLAAAKVVSWEQVR